MSDESREDRFEHLYSTHSGAVFAYALRRGARQADAEDLVVETFIVCWRRLEEVPDPPLPWLLAVARRVFANQMRSKRRYAALGRRIAGSLVRHPSPSANPPLDSAGVKRALASLSDEDREVLALVVLHGLTHAEAGAVMGCTRNAFTKRYLRARRNLRAQLHEDRTYTGDGQNELSGPNVEGVFNEE